MEMMKHIYLYIIGALMLMASCDLHTSDNGELDGFWQLQAVDTLATGGGSDMRTSQITWAVQSSLLEVRIADQLNNKTDFMFLFKHKNDTLLLYNPYIIDRQNGDVAVEDSNLLKPYGIHELEPQFQILELNDSKMILQSDSLRLYFRKY